MTPSTLAILPVKRFALAKQRLSAHLAPDQRQTLAQAMVEDVLDALLATSLLAAVAVVTDEPAVAEFAGRHGAHVLVDGGQPGQSAAVTVGITYALERGFERVLLVPGDCPGIDGETLAALLSAPATPPAVTIVADRHGLGTNALLLTPVDVIAPSFGPGSFERHRAAATAAGAQWRVADLPALALDVDTADDLAALTQRLAGGPTRTAAVLAC